MYHITKRQVLVRVEMVNSACSAFVKLSKFLNYIVHFQAFPDALYHQLLLSMTHPDHETRVGAHSVFSVVLMPSLCSPQLNQKRWMAQNVQSEIFSIESASPIGTVPDRKEIAGAEEKHAVHLYPGHNLLCALTDGKEV